MALSLDEALGVSLLDESDDSIHIDVNTRQVTIPESQKLFGVESDDAVEVKHIVIDGRYSDGTDLSGFNWRVNYRNANGQKNTYLITNVTANADSIEFDWVIRRSAVAFKGSVYFVVCAYKKGDDGRTTPEWNSTLGQGTVLEGLEVDVEDIGGDEVLLQLTDILAQTQDAAREAQEVLASIPPNYSDLSKKVDNQQTQIDTLNEGGLNLKDEVIEADIRGWLDDHPEATTTVQDGAITEEKINESFLPWIRNDYVTPEMFGAVGDGVADDTEAVKAALAAKKAVLLLKTYSCSEKIDISNKRIYGKIGVLDFTNYTGDDCVVSNGNGTKINGLTIRNGKNITGYGLKLNYIANNGIVENVQVRECKNGMYISGSWYNKFSNIFIKSSDSENGICLMIGDEYNANSANGMLFDNIFLHSGAYGLVFKDVTINSLVFSGMTVEKQTVCGIYSDNSSGNISINGIYFEDCALNSEYPLLDIGYIYTIVSNILVRGTYTNCINSYKGPNIIQVGRVYNPSGITVMPGLLLERPASLASNVWPALTLNQNKKLEGFRITKAANNNLLRFIVKFSSQSDFAVKILSFGNLASDSTASYFDEIVLFIRIYGSRPKAYVNAVHHGERDLTSTYTVNYTRDGGDVTVELGNSNAKYAEYSTLNIITVVSAGANIKDISEAET